MNCLLPYNITIKKIINRLEQSDKMKQFNNISKEQVIKELLAISGIDSSDTNQYMLKKVFTELLYFLQINPLLQYEEIKKSTINVKDIYKWIEKEIIVLYGSLLEQEIANLLIHHQLSPIFTNTTNSIINMHNRMKMEQFDLVVQSLRDNSYHGFDIKHGTIFRKTLSQNKLYIYNSGLKTDNIIKIYNNYTQSAEKDFKHKINSYILFVCYDMLTRYNYDNQSDYYRQILNDIPNHTEKVCFVIDLKQLFKTVTDDDNDERCIFNKKSPYILSLYNQTKLNYYDNVFAININSPICMTLKDFILTKLV